MPRYYFHVRRGQLTVPGHVLNYDALCWVTRVATGW
jgi:hypothetical protein